MAMQLFVANEMEQTWAMSPLGVPSGGSERFTLSAFLCRRVMKARVERTASMAAGEGLLVMIQFNWT